MIGVPHFSFTSVHPNVSLGASEARLDRIFHLAENQTTARKELLAGITTFLTMAYIIVVQPAVLSGALIGIPLSYAIADGLAPGFIRHPAIKLLGGRGREAGWLNYLLAVVLLLYFILVRSRMGQPTRGTRPRRRTSR